jgi:hypothetical protein
LAEKLNTPAAVATQPKIDAAKIQKLETKLLGHMRLAAEYSCLADSAANIFDSALIEILTEKFLSNARDTSKTLVELRKAKAVQ